MRIKHNINEKTHVQKLTPPLHKHHLPSFLPSLSFLSTSSISHFHGVDPNPTHMTRTPRKQQLARKASSTLSTSTSTASSSAPATSLRPPTYDAFNNDPNSKYFGSSRYCKSSFFHKVMHRDLDRNQRRSSSLSLQDSPWISCPNVVFG